MGGGKAINLVPCVETAVDVPTAYVLCTQTQGRRLANAIGAPSVHTGVHTKKFKNRAERGVGATPAERPKRGGGATPAAEVPRPGGVVSASEPEIGRGGGA